MPVTISSGPCASHRVGIVVFEQVKMLDVAGPSEVFAEANRNGAAYELTFCSVGGGPVTSSTGMRLMADCDAALPGLGFDTLLVMGGDELPTRALDANLIDAVTALADNSGRVCSICTGAFILARASLLNGHRATTHWQHAGLLARAYPEVSVEPDAIFVKDGSLVTSAGVTAGIDLALALLEDDHGEEMARAVARSLVVFLQRPGGQSQFSPTLQGARPRTAVLRSAHDAIAADPAGDHSIPALSARFAVSPRHLTRLFRDELGTTPARFVETVRFDAAKAALDAGHSVSAAAGLAGYGNPESFRRAFAARLGIPPRAYQQRFRSAQRPDATPVSRPTGQAVRTATGPTSTAIPKVAR